MHTAHTTTRGRASPKGMHLRCGMVYQHNIHRVHVLLHAICAHAQTQALTHTHTHARTRQNTNDAYIIICMHLDI